MNQLSALAFIVGLLWLDSTSTALERLTSLPGNEGSPVFSPDGSQLLFAARGAGGLPDLALLGLEDRSIRWLTDTPLIAEAAPQWSPDGGSILFMTRGPSGASVDRIDISAGRVDRVVPSSEQARWFRVAPAGDLIAVGAEDGMGSRVRLFASDGKPHGTPTLIAGETAPAGWLADGSGFVLTIIRGAAQDLFHIDWSSGRLRALTDHPHEEWRPTTAPHGTAVAYYSTYDESMTDLRLVDVRTRKHRRLTDHPAEDFHPVWGPRADRLAFLSDRHSKSGLWVLNLDSKKPVPVLPTTRFSGAPVWAPDGRSLVVPRATLGSRALRVPSAGCASVVLTSPQIDAANPLVAPVSGALVFESSSFGSEQGLAVIGTDGAVRSWSPEAATVASVSWASDGARIAARRNRGGWRRTGDVWVNSWPDPGKWKRMTSVGWVGEVVWCGGHIYFNRSVSTPPGQAGTHALWRVAEAGGRPSLLIERSEPLTPTDCRDGEVVLTMVTRGRPSVYLLNTPNRGVVETELMVEDAEDARMACDGRLAFVSHRAGQPDLYVRDPTSQVITRLTDSAGRESRPVWSLDCDSLFYSDSPGEIDLWIVRLPAALRSAATG